MMHRYGRLSDLSLNQAGTIEDLSFNPLLKQRLISMGLIYGHSIEKVNDAGNIMMVKVGNMRLAVSREIADKIGVDYIADGR